MNLDNPIPTGSNPNVSTPQQFWTVFLLGMFGGCLGLHRFYAGKTQSAVLQLVTCGGCGAWALIDTIMILAGMFRNQNGMIYRNPQPTLSFAIFVVVMGAATVVELHNHRMSPYLPRRMNPGRATMSQEELNSFGTPTTSTNAALEGLFTDYAKQHFGYLAVVEFEGPDTNGTYQVTVHMRANYGGVQTSEYLVTLDATGTNIATWK
ncbi:MAG TPA: TM2 domain-containing protein [Candidatus Acidoferrales bacterium]|jgi:TM2 domain-containing membrane protein YozV|nr:TM2 domain-containing protein [Candidatus Acidoferrales bacterium]